MASAIQVDFLIAGLVDNDGFPLEAGTVGFFETDGVTPKTVWEDADKNTISANPVTLDSRGTAKVFADGLYSIEVKDSLGNVVSTEESLSFFLAGAGSADVLGIDATQFGSGDDADAINQAIASALGADATVFLKNIPGGWNIDANVTVPANIEILFLWGAYLDVQLGFTFAHNKLRAPLFNIHRGSGTVTVPSTNTIQPSIWEQSAIDGNQTLNGIVTVPTTIELNDVQAIAPATEINILDNLKGNAGTLTVDDDLNVTGTITAPTLSITTLNATTVNATDVIATNLTGTLQTAAQPNITSVGTLTSLTMAGPISGVTTLTANDVNATNVTGTLQTAAQPNVTSLGLLTGIQSSGDLDLQGTANIIDSVSNNVDLLDWAFTPTLLTFPIGGQINTEGGALARFELTNNLLRADNGANITIQLDRTIGKITAEQSEIGRKIIKLTPGATAGTDINAAISALGAGGGIVYLPIGTYTIDVAVTVGFSGIELLGDGIGLTVINSNIAGDLITQNINIDNLLLRNMTVSGAGGTTASRCYNSGGSNERFTAINVLFTGASNTLLDNIPDNTVLDRSTLSIPAGSIGLTPGSGVQDLYIYKTTLSGNVGSSIGIEADSENIYIEESHISSLSEAIKTTSGNTLNLWIKKNTFTSCATPISGGVVAAENVFIEDNVFDSNTAFAIDLGAIKSYVVTGNLFDNQSGTSVISFDRTRGEGIINKNTFKDCSVSSYLIQAAVNAESTERVIVDISNNLVTDSTFDFFTDLAVLATSSANEMATISNNQAINCTLTNTPGIGGCDGLCTITGNKFFNTTIPGSATTVIISAPGDKSQVQHNTIVDITAGDGSSVLNAVEYSGEDSLINNNIIDAQFSSTGNITGVLETGVARGNVQNNSILTVNAGTGTGNAFNVAMTNGVATGNTYNGSDAIGTLTISSGTVANNDG